MKAETRYKVNQVITLLIVWSIIGFLVSIYDLVHYNDAKDAFELMVPFKQSFTKYLLLSMFGPVAGGIIGGYIIVFKLKDRMQKYSYGKMLLLNSLIFFVIISLVAVVAVILFSMTYYDTFELSKKVLSRSYTFLTGLGVIRATSFWYIILIGTVFMLAVGDKYGPGVLKNFIKGKYHEPRLENRVFMFIDLKSSTTIAEDIGSMKYFKLLRKFFADITTPVINHYGEIYQYVGDEIVVTWLVDKVRLPDNALACFDEMVAQIENNRAEYEQTFGVFPRFKAAIHCGEVTVGEVGIVKKEIVYSGDVLNTTSRIMDQCNTYGLSLLFSEAYKSILAKEIEAERVGKVALRGKQEEVIIYGLKAGEEI